MKKEHVLIIPGLGDDSWAIKFQTRKWEKKYGIIPHIFVFGWQSAGSFNQRFKLLEAELNSLHRKYGKVSLLGSSAGGSAVINLFSKNKTKIDRIVCVCARLRDPDVHQRAYYPKNKIGIFVESIKLCERSIANLTTQDKKKILTIRPILDDVVPVRTMTIKGATNKQIVAAQHMLGIYLALTWHSKLIAEFIRG